MKSSQILIMICLFPTLFVAACIPSKKLTVAATATLLEEVAKSTYQQSDLKMVREGMPAYLMLMDGMVEALPGNEQLLINTAQAYSSFASVFVEEKDPEYATCAVLQGTDVCHKGPKGQGAAGSPSNTR